MGFEEDKEKMEILGWENTWNDSYNTVFVKEHEGYTLEVHNHNSPDEVGMGHYNFYWIIYGFSFDDIPMVLKSRKAEWGPEEAAIACLKAYKIIKNKAD